LAVITISRGSYSMGKAVAEQVADRLGYRVISRDLLLDASERFHIPEIKLIRAIHDAPGILGRLSHNKDAYLAYIRSALAERAAEDNLVYHGLAGHLLLKQIPGVLKVRITADLEMRIANEMQREKIGAGEARELLLKDDQQRRKWTQNLLGADPWDSNLYDLVICIDRIALDHAVDIICGAAASDGFTIKAKELQMLRDLALASRIKAMLAAQHPATAVSCQYGNVIVYTKEKGQGSHKLHRRIEAIGREIEGVHNLEIHMTDQFPDEAL